METESSQSDANQSWSQVNPADIEARLNALSSQVENEVACETEQPPTSPVELFMADPSQTQLLLRTRQCEGEASGETVTSFNRLPFASGQQRQVLHLAFVPDLCETPAVTAQIVNGNGRIKISRAATFGVRLEIILAAPCETSFALVVETTCTAADRPA